MVCCSALIEHATSTIAVVSLAEDQQEEDGFVLEVALPSYHLAVTVCLEWTADNRYGSTKVRTNEAIKKILAETVLVESEREKVNGKTKISQIVNPFTPNWELWNSHYSSVETVYVRYTKWQWALSCITKKATMYSYFETINDAPYLVYRDRGATLRLGGGGHRKWLNIVLSATPPPLPTPWSLVYWASPVEALTVELMLILY